MILKTNKYISSNTHRSVNKIEIMIFSPTFNPSFQLFLNYLFLFSFCNGIMMWWSKDDWSDE